MGDFQSIRIMDFKKIEIPTNVFFPSNLADLRGKTLLQRIREWGGMEDSPQDDDLGKTIIRYLDPYLHRIGKLIGKEIPLSELHPPFKRSSRYRYGFDIPETPYKLLFSEEALDEYRNVNLLVVSPGVRVKGRATAGGDLATVGKLAYSGRE